MQKRLELTLRPGHQSFPRVVARLHALGLEIFAVRLMHDQLRMTVGGSPSPERIRAAMDRLVDVTSVTCTTEHAVTSTTSVVSRQPLIGEKVGQSALVGCHGRWRPAVV